MNAESQTASAMVAPMPTEANSLLLDIQTAAGFLGLSVWQIRGLVATGELKVVKVGRKFYFRKPALVRWAERAEN